MLIVNPLVAEALEVQFEALQLDAFAIGRVRERQRAEIRLAGLRADRCKLRADDLDHIIAAWKLVLKRLQQVAGLRGWHRHRLLLPFPGDCAMMSCEGTGDRRQGRGDRGQKSNTNHMRIAEIYASLQGEGLLTRHAERLCARER